MKVINDFLEYIILDLNKGKKLEAWNNIILNRPDPQVIWDKNENVDWSIAHASYTRSNTGGGHWQIKKDIPSSWTISYQDLKFNLKLMGFKHTGLFPEQAYNWNVLRNSIKKADRKVKVLNLFAYTGAASIACLKEGASVVHVDSSRGMIEWAKENVKLNHLEDASVRFLVDDVRKFVKREIRRGNKYDIIIMDPPSFGRGAKQEVWNIETDLDNLIKDTAELLSDDPLLFIINSYTTGLSKTVLEDILYLRVNSKFKGLISSDELGLPVKDSNLILPCGLYARWERQK
ncbi:MAG TPA: class I SAM-dependent methyltransferase [Candidatus Caccenecus avistercoris]|nr:class I SAM-dependent methyltransferase [Candidatus Caccenecus avistercoris]